MGATIAKRVQSNQMKFLNDLSWKRPSDFAGGTHPLLAKCGQSCVKLSQGKWVESKRDDITLRVVNPIYGYTLCEYS